MTNIWTRPAPRSPASTAALSEIRSHLAQSGHRTHGDSWWQERGIRVSRLDTGMTVAWCTWCYQAAKRGGFTEHDAQQQAWNVHGFPSYCEESALEHFRTTHESDPTP